MTLPIGLLEVEFKSGAVHQYYNVPEFIHEQFLNARSKGKYLNDNIRKRFRHTLTRQSGSHSDSGSSARGQYSRTSIYAATTRLHHLLDDDLYVVEYEVHLLATRCTVNVEVDDKDQPVQQVYLEAKFKLADAVKSLLGVLEA